MRSAFAMENPADIADLCLWTEMEKPKSYFRYW